MDKNLLLIDECCRQGKKVNPNDTPNKPVNVIYNRYFFFFFFLKFN